MILLRAVILVPTAKTIIVHYKAVGNQICNIAPINKIGTRSVCSNIPTPYKSSTPIDSILALV
ncbi:MAG: hypothetical protein V3V33_13325 [Candidatus Lokiarchaeia archaeon]